MTNQLRYLAVLLFDSLSENLFLPDWASFSSFSNELPGPLNLVISVNF
jgi:hypothetical protein